MKPISHIRYSLVRSIPLLVLGIFLLIKPDGSVTTFIRLLAAVLLIGGLFALYYTWQESRNEYTDKGLQRLLYLVAFMLLLFAVLLLLFPGSLQKWLCFPQESFCCFFRNANHSYHPFSQVIPIGLPWFIYLNPVAVFILSLIIMLNPFDTAKMLAVLRYHLSGICRYGNSTSRHHLPPGQKPVNCSARTHCHGLLQREASRQAGEAVFHGLEEACRYLGRPVPHTTLLPLADGGEGTVTALMEGLGGAYHSVMVCGPSWHTCKSRIRHSSRGQ